MALSPALTRSDLSRVFPDNPKVVRAFEQLFAATATNTEAVTTGALATQEINDATVLTLSSNDTFTNERLFAIDPAAFSLTDEGPGGRLILALLNVIQKTSVFPLYFDLDADTRVRLPTQGVIPSSAVGPYADDTAAAAAGVRVGEWYAKTGGTVAWRVA